MNRQTTLKNDQPTLTGQLCFALYSASLTMTKFYKPILGPLGLTYPQYIVLLSLCEKGEARLLDLGELLFLDSGTLTPLLKKLARLGLVHRQRSTHDERELRISITPQGRKLAKIAAKIVGSEALEATQCNLGEREALTKLLKNLRNSLASYPVRKNAKETS